jgi:hypothetical protein
MPIDPFSPFIEPSSCFASFGRPHDRQIHSATFSPSSTIPNLSAPRAALHRSVTENQ